MPLLREATAAPCSVRVTFWHRTTNQLDEDNHDRGTENHAVPDSLDEPYEDENSAGSQRAMEAMLKMKKINLAALQRANDGRA
jgi:hypothetical protein